MKTVSTQKTAQRKVPYEKKQKKATKRKAPSTKRTDTLPLSPPSTLSTDNPWGFELARDMYLEHLAKHYPKITPRHDYDILMLGSHYQEGTISEVFAWVDSMMELEIMSLGSREAVFEATKKTLGAVIDPTGRKPRPGRDRVDIRPIPNSKYSIRLWPGSLLEGEYCMDFVDSLTKQPVNSPFEFELWGAPNPEAPWLCAPAGRILSLERNSGIRQHEIRPGEERFVLRDGLTCLLKRPGKRDVQFMVPMRQRPPPQYDLDILDFPKNI